MKHESRLPIGVYKCTVNKSHDLDKDVSRQVVIKKVVSDGWTNSYDVF